MTSEKKIRIYLVKLEVERDSYKALYESRPQSKFYRSMYKERLSDIIILEKILNDEL